MEKIMSVEDKIRRAEEIYARRQRENPKRNATVSVNTTNKKNVKLFKKMIIQILISLLIYLIIVIIQNNNYIFSQDFLNKVNTILSYDINFEQLYKNVKGNIENNIKKIKKYKEGAIGGDIENNVENNIENETNNLSEQNEISEKNEDQNSNVEQLSQEEQDIAKIKETTTFIKPIEGTISSKFGQRETTAVRIPKNHTGIDIAASMGTKIIASTDGEVVLASEEGDYGKHLKIQIGEVSIVYAHCNSLYVKQGEKVSQGQEIAEVGSTGNSTGPHLHFEIRLSEKTIDPEKILQF